MKETNHPNVSTPLHLLKSVFGYESFRGLQAGIIEHVLQGQDALVIMPTGSGKSLCYQIPALVKPGLAVVVSPLIALMRDQVQALRQCGVPAAYLNSSLSLEQAREVESQAVSNQLKLLYVAPERVATERFRSLLKRLEPSLFAIDEAHCVSQWGHDFRPEYLELSRLHEEFPDVPRLALTATADQATREDILARLGLHQARSFIGGYDRPNIRYTVVPKENGKKQLLEFLRERPIDQSGIVYCLSRRKVEEVSAWLVQQGRRAVPYHAGLDTQVRNLHQERFLRETGLIVVATIAFGMGIDKPDVRYVVHLDMPRSIEAYYQETGRAGRDGLPAEAWMAYGFADVVAHRQMSAQSQAQDSFKRIEQRRLNALLGYCETVRCRRQVLLEYFSDSCAPCGNCDTCLAPVESWDGTEVGQKALSAVYRTGQRFGAGHLIDLLRGHETPRMRSLGHVSLPTFGVGKELDEKQWSSVFRQLVAAGYLTVDLAGHGSLTFTPRSSALLKGQERIELRRDRKRSSKSAPRSTTMDVDVDEGLLARLKARRRELAQEQNLPPYCVLHDSTLIEMARSRPASRAELSRISGWGEVKLGRYGDEFLAVLSA